MISKLYILLLFIINFAVGNIRAPRQTSPTIKEELDYASFLSYNDAERLIGQFQEPPNIQHRNYNQLTSFLRSLETNHSKITHLYSAGKSVEKRNLWVLIIAENPDKHIPGKPEFKYVANMHGNEVLGQVALLNLAYVLCVNYGRNDYITRLLKTIRIHIMPSMNPDGREIAFEGDRQGYTGRANKNNIDINRNFPCRFPVLCSKYQKPIQPEVESVMNWSKQYPFVLSANLHGGSLVANYPYDDKLGASLNYGPKTPDDPLFKKLAYSYAKAHPTMSKTGVRCGLRPEGDYFINGITNGDAWYTVSGGMQDWNYLNTNDYELTIEMGCFKFPYAELLPNLWNEHKYALLIFLNEVHKGVKGFIFEQNTNLPIPNADVKINDNNHVVHSAASGDYWRLLLPGTYVIVIEHKDYFSESRTISIPNESPFSIQANFTLKRRSSRESKTLTPQITTTPPSSESNFTKNKFDAIFETKVNDLAELIDSNIVSRQLFFTNGDKYGNLDIYRIGNSSLRNHDLSLSMLVISFQRDRHKPLSSTTSAQLVYLLAKGAARENDKATQILSRLTVWAIPIFPLNIDSESLSSRFKYLVKWIKKTNIYFVLVLDDFADKFIQDTNGFTGISNKFMSSKLSRFFTERDVICDEYFSKKIRLINERLRILAGVPAFTIGLNVHPCNATPNNANDLPTNESSALITNISSNIYQFLITDFQGLNIEFVDKNSVDWSAEFSVQIVQVSNDVTSDYVIQVKKSLQLLAPEGKYNITASSETYATLEPYYLVDVSRGTISNFSIYVSPSAVDLPISSFRGYNLTKAAKFCGSQASFMGSTSLPSSVIIGNRDEQYPKNRIALVGLDKMANETLTKFVGILCRHQNNTDKEKSVMNSTIITVIPHLQGEGHDCADNTGINVAQYYTLMQKSKFGFQDVVIFMTGGGLKIQYFSTDMDGSRSALKNEFADRMARTYACHHSHLSDFGSLFTCFPSKTQLQRGNLDTGTVIVSEYEDDLNPSEVAILNLSTCVSRKIGTHFNFTPNDDLKPSHFTRKIPNMITLLVRFADCRSKDTNIDYGAQNYLSLVETILVSNIGVVGQLLTSNNNSAVSGAIVSIRRTFLRSSNATTASNELGYFRMSAVSGPYELMISKKGFDPYKQNIHVRDDQQPRFLKIYLTPISQRTLSSLTAINRWPLISVIIVSAALILGFCLCLYAYCSARSSAANKTADYFRQGFRPLINKRRGNFNRNIGNGFGVEYHKMQNTDDENSLDDSEEDDVIMLNKDAKDFPSKTNYLNRRSSDNGLKSSNKSKVSEDWLQNSEIFADESDDELYVKTLSVKA